MKQGRSRTFVQCESVSRVEKDVTKGFTDFSFDQVLCSWSCYVESMDYPVACYFRRLACRRFVCEFDRTAGVIRIVNSVSEQFASVISREIKWQYTTEKQGIERYKDLCLYTLFKNRYYYPREHRLRITSNRLVNQRVSCWKSGIPHGAGNPSDWLDRRSNLPAY